MKQSGLNGIFLKKLLSFRYLRQFRETLRVAADDPVIVLGGRDASVSENRREDYCADNGPGKHRREQRQFVSGRQDQSGRACADRIKRKCAENEPSYKRKIEKETRHLVLLHIVFAECQGFKRFHFRVIKDKEKSKAEPVIGDNARDHQKKRPQDHKDAPERIHRYYTEKCAETRKNRIRKNFPAPDDPQPYNRKPESKRAGHEQQIQESGETEVQFVGIRQCPIIYRGIVQVVKDLNIFLERVFHDAPQPHDLFYYDHRQKNAEHVQDSRQYKDGHMPLHGF